MLSIGRFYNNTVINIFICHVDTNFIHSSTKRTTGTDSKNIRFNSNILIKYEKRMPAVSTTLKEFFSEN